MNMQPEPIQIVSAYTYNLLSNKIPIFENKIRTKKDGREISIVELEQGNITCLRMARFIDNHRKDLTVRDLKYLQKALGNRIHQITTITQGIRGFFYYLFKRAFHFDLKQQKYYYEALKGFIVNVIKNKKEIARTAKLAENPIKQDDIKKAALPIKNNYDPESPLPQIHLLSPQHLPNPSYALKEIQKQKEPGDNEKSQSENEKNITELALEVAIPFVDEINQDLGLHTDYQSPKDLKDFLEEIFLQLPENKNIIPLEENDFHPQLQEEKEPNQVSLVQEEVKEIFPVENEGLNVHPEEAIEVSMLPLDELPPPPPPLFLQPEILFKFANEPDLPKKIEMTKYSKKNGENEIDYENRINDEIMKLEIYVRDVELALVQPRQIKKQVEDLEAELPESVFMLANQNESLKFLMKNIEVLRQSKDEEVVHLIYAVKDKKGQVSQKIKIPYFPQAPFDAINAQLKEIGDKQLPRGLIIPEALHFFTKRLPQAEKDLLTLTQDVEKIQRSLKELKDQKYEGLSFERFMAELAKKEKKLEGWKRSIKMRKNALELSKKTAHKNSKEKFSSAIEKMKEEIAKKFPGYSDYRNLPQNIGIILNHPKKRHSINELVRPPE